MSAESSPGSSEPHVSTHAADRWTDRSDDPTVDPVVAWRAGEAIEGHTLTADEVRYHHPTRTVILRKDSHLVTVIDARTARHEIRFDVRRNTPHRPTEGAE